MSLVSEQWQLRERPFEPVTDARFYFESKAHREALARLGYLVNQETMYLGMLSGEIGCGKSLTRQVFASQIDPARHFLVQFENSSFDFDDHLRRLLSESGAGDGLSLSQGSYALYEMTRRFLSELHTVHQRHLVLIFDEAQDMSPEALAGLKRLSNLNDEGGGRLTIILIGQPELRQVVSKFPALDQRISLRFHLNPLDLEDTRLYLKHRLLAAGHPDGEVFENEAVELLFKASRGVAREINRLAKLSLETARSASSSFIRSGHVRTVVEDLRRHQQMPVLEGEPE
ncbi:MAG: AAA family ATPase [Verrucomicrobiota bacterium]